MRLEMKKVFFLMISAAVLFCSCSEYAEPNVAGLMSDIMSQQDVVEPTDATFDEIGIIFDIDTSTLEDCAVCYSGSGGYADMAAIFKLRSESGVQELEQKLKDYIAARYEDFKGYAPIEADKIENGRVIVRGRYLILAILPDISLAQQTIDTAFEA